MAFKPQTAIRGVFSVALINVIARLAGYGTHLAITTYIGLTDRLDAYYVAMTVLSIFIFAFGDAFDFLGIPRLVRTLQEEGEEAFRLFAGSILSFALLLSAGLCLLLLALAPWTTWIAPGFTAGKKESVIRNLIYLAPMAILYLPYHAVGSFLRSKRRFRDFYLGELIIAAVALVVILSGKDFPYIIPAAFSTAYLVVFLYVVRVGFREFRFSADLRSEKMRNLYRVFLLLLPLYFSSHLYALVDRAFASYLPTGGISALSYGFLIALIPRSVLMMDNVFMTPLSETTEMGRMMGDILNGISIISIPIAFFTAAYSTEIVKAALERGMFTPESTRMTGEALTFFATAIPAFFAWPFCYRMFQINEKMGTIGILTVISVLLNVALNWSFLRMGMGIKGLALATSLANYSMVSGAFLMLRRHGTPILTREAGVVSLISIGISALSLALATVLPLSPLSTPGLVLHATVYVSSAGLLFFMVPNHSIRFWRETVFREIFRRK